MTPPPSTLTILHTNDLHGAIGLLPWLGALIARERARASAVLTLDAGDAALGDMLPPLGAALFAALHHDGVTPGNAENDLERHRAALAATGRVSVVANATTARRDGLVGVPVIMRIVGTRRVAVLGLTTPAPYPPGHPLHRQPETDIVVEEPLTVARQWAPRLRAEADVVIVLSHLGLRRDVELARQVPGLDLIVGGHSHHRLQEPLIVGRTAIVQSGVGGAYLGVAEAPLDGGRTTCTGHLEPIWGDLHADPILTGRITDTVQRTAPLFLQHIGDGPGCWADPWQENAWANLVTDTLREAAGTDIALVKASSIFPALPPGMITLWDLYRALPGMALDEATGLQEVVALTVTGEDLAAIGEHCVDDLPCDMAPDLPRHLCWPGNNLLQTSGLEMTFDLGRPLGQRVAHLSVHGADVEPHRRYTVATSGFLARGYSGYHWLRRTEERRVVGEERPLIMEALRREQSWQQDGRLALLFPQGPEQVDM